MAMVAGATRAMIFHTRQNQFEIRAGFECAGYRRKKAWPAGAAFVFHRERSCASSITVQEGIERRKVGLSRNLKRAH